MTYRLYGRTEKDDSGPLMSTQAVMVVQFTVYTLSLMNYYPYTEMVLGKGIRWHIISYFKPILRLIHVSLLFSWYHTFNRKKGKENELG